MEKLKFTIANKAKATAANALVKLFLKVASVFTQHALRSDFIRVCTLTKTTATAACLERNPRNRQHDHRHSNAAS